MKSILWYLIAGTRGGVSRARIIHLLEKKPSNANKISKMLKLDYKTVRHHLKVLEKNHMIYAVGKDEYGAVYFTSEMLKDNLKSFQEIWERIGKDLGKD